MKIKLTLNGKSKKVDVPANRTLLDVLRAQGLWSVKHGCEWGECGSCTVLVDGLAVQSCMMLAVQADGKRVDTVESLATPSDMHPLQEAFLDHGVIHCGYCISGMIMSVKALIDKNPEPTEEEVRDAIAGNLCHCTNNVKPVEAIMRAVRRLRGKWN